LVAQEQAPALHVAPGSQVTPQPPQLWLSVWVSTQELEQTVELAPVHSAAQLPAEQNGVLPLQAVPQAPQLLASMSLSVQA
jgi:hypothetical protein